MSAWNMMYTMTRQRFVAAVSLVFALLLCTSTANAQRRPRRPNDQTMEFLAERALTGLARMAINALMREVLRSASRAIVHRIIKEVHQHALKRGLGALRRGGRTTPGAVILSVKVDPMRKPGNHHNKRSEFWDSKSRVDRKAHLPDPHGVVRITSVSGAGRKMESIFPVHTHYDQPRLVVGLLPSNSVKGGDRLTVVLNDNDDQGPFDHRIAACVSSLPAPGRTRTFRCTNSVITVKVNSP